MLDLRKRESFSAIPLLNKWLHNIKLAPRLRSLLNQADLKWTAGGLLLACAACFVIVSYASYLRFHIAIVALLIGAAFSFAPIGVVMQKRSSRFGKFEQGLPEALDLMVSSLRVGHSLNSSLGLVTRESPEPIRGEFPHLL